MTKCECGEWSGEPCRWHGPASETTTVEFMPANLRNSHQACGNAGVWPHNGALRITVSKECAADMIAMDYEWCSEVVS